MSRGAVLLGVALQLALAVACSRPSEPGEPFLARLLDEDPPAQFRLDEAIEGEPTAVLGPPGCLTERGWETSLSPSEAHCVQGVLRLKPRQRRVTLARAVDFDAAEVDAFQLAVGGMARQLVGLEWAGAGERFDPRRRVEGSVRVDPASGEGRCRLRVEGHPEWRGRIARLRLTLTMPPPGAGGVRSLEAVRERVDPARLDRLAGRPWKIELDNEMRGGRLGVPGHPFRWRTATRRGAELWLALGVLGSCEGAVRFTVDAVDPAGGEGDRRPLFSRELPCDRSGWEETRVPLDGAATKGPITFEFATAVLPEGGRFEPSSGVPVWAGPELVAGRPPSRRSVVLISVDTLRPDRLSLYGHRRETTPKLDARAARGAVVFERAVAAAPWTLPSHASIFTGLDAERHGVNQGRGLPPSLLTLADVLRGAGYATRAVTAGGFVHQQYGFADGFDVYSSFSERMGFADELESGVARAKAALKLVGDRDFFLFFHTYAVHNPFRPRQPYLERLTGRTTRTVVDVELIQPVADDGFLARRALFATADGKRIEAPADGLHELAIDLYDSGIAYADERLDDLLAAIDDLGLGARTLVVLTSDHGELFGEHGLVNHVSLYDENVLVPLVVFDPGRGPGVRRVRRQVRSVDLLPTLLELLGLPSPAGLDGRSFASMLGGDAGAGGARDGARDAWSYASASNFGISLRRTDGTTYVARNDAWVADGPREELLRAAPAGGDGDLASLRAATERQLREALAGLRIRARNAGEAPLRVALWGADVGPTRMKLERLGAGVLVAHGDRPAELTVAPGEEVTLVVEGRSVAPLHARVDHPPWGSYQVDVDPATLDRTLWYGRTSEGWQVGHGEPAPDTAVSFWWQGGRDAAGARGEVPADEELQRQLRALGYVH
jgi:arylsulfatase A-like enzyme